MAYRTPRIQRDTLIADARGVVSGLFQRWWNSFADKLDAQEAAQDVLLAQVIAAQAAATAAAAAAVVAQSAAAAAAADAAAAQVSADAAIEGVIVVDERTTSLRQFWNLQ